MQSLLGVSASPTRAERKRFRRLVTTMREDLYLAERGEDDALAGLAVIAYLRGLGPHTAIVRSLHGDGETRALLLGCARARAAARGCTRLEVHLDADDPAASALAAEPPWADGPHGYHATVPGGARETP